MFTAHEIAAYLLGTFDRETGDNITNMKLQKLLYYAQGFHAAMHGGERLFDDSIEAWPHGPLVPSVYATYQDCGSSAIEFPRDFDPDRYLPETRELLDVVNEVYGQYGASGLRNLSHSEAPWIEARKIGRESEITLRSITTYFEQLVDAGRRGEIFDKHPIWPMDRFRHQRRPEIAARFEAIRGRMSRMIRPLDSEQDPWGED